jgi:hypothetical protein
MATNAQLPSFRRAAWIGPEWAAPDGPRRLSGDGPPDAASERSRLQVIDLKGLFLWR